MGSFRTHAVFDDGLYAYLRTAGGQQALCILNTGTEPVRRRVELPGGMAEMAVVHDLYADKSIAVEDGAVSCALDVGEGLILV